jgi:hypothetical protein
MDRTREKTGEANLSGPRAAFRAVRRGTVLILVLGVLALLAVITAVYVSLGQADRRTGETVKRSKANDEAADRVADYIAGVIGADALSTTIERPRPAGPTGAGQPPTMRREAFDYPYTDYAFRSMFPPAQRIQRDSYRFDPAGSISVWPLADGTQTDLDPRNASDPFLASTEPTYLSPDGADTLNTSNTWEDQFKNNMDWAHISNIAPDGRYVNLFNLRAPSASNPIAPNVGAGFDAPTWELSGLNNLGARLNSTAPLSFLQPAAGNADENPPAPSTTPNFPIVNNTYSNTMFNRPAFFSNAQRFAFRPMDVADGLDWRSPDYIRYQWADADGDGFADARWQELIDASDPTTVVNLMPAGEYRWFVAARVIDMSGLVNVNTAGDFLTSGSYDIPTGFTPAEVDLRRLLMLTDVPGGTAPTAASGLRSGGYELLRNPATAVAGQPENVPSNYAEYRDAGGQGIRAAKAGNYAYAAIKKSLLSGTTPEAGFDLSADPVDPINSAKLTSGSWDWTGGSFGNLSRFGVGSPTPPVNPFARMMAYQEAASAAFRGEFARGGARGFFGASDASELFTFRASNDDALLSRLEQATGGRIPAGDVANTGAGTTYDGVSVAARFDPLRSSRDEEWERRGRTTVDDPSETLVRGANPRVLRQMAYDVRKNLTPMSGSRPYASRPIEVPYDSTVTARTLDSRVDLKLDVVSELGTAIFQSDADLKISAARNIFKGYLDSLAPFLAETPTALDWRPQNASTPWTRRTLTYGYDGPELPFNLAAHLTVNLIDAYDDDAKAVGSGSDPAIDTRTDDPTVVTVVLDQSAIGVLQSEAGTPVKDRKFPFAASGDGFRIPAINYKAVDPKDSTKYVTTKDDSSLAYKLRNRNNNPKTAALYSPVKNVYGLEAFPIVTQAATLFIYADSTSGSADRLEDDGMGNTTMWPTIDGDLDPNNEDLILQAVAFQIHNPFDKKINVTSAPGGEYQYYITYGGVCYKLCDQQADGTAASIELAPGETRWFYFAGDLDRYGKHFDDLPGSPGGGKDFLPNLIAQQLGAGTASGAKSPARMMQLDPVTGNTIDQKSAKIKTRVVAGIGDASVTDPENFIVRLWRAVRLGGSGDVPGSAANAVENDMLVDRMRDEGEGGRPRLTRRLKEQVVEVSGVPSNDMTTADEGLTLMFVNTIFRLGETGAPPTGGLPAYMLEGTTVGSVLRNKGDRNNDYQNVTTVGYLIGDVDLLDFSDPGPNMAAKSASLFKSSIYDVGATGLDASSLGYPDAKFGHPVPNNKSNLSLDQIRASFYLANNRLRSEFKSMGPTGTAAVSTQQRVPGVIRLGDLVSQLAIGAEFDPWRGVAPDYSGELDTEDPGTTLNGLFGQIVTNAWISDDTGGKPDPTRAAADDPRWTTMGEALAQALDFDEGREKSGTNIPNPYYRVGRLFKQGPTDSIWPKLHRGCLVLDDYTPYENRVTPADIKYDAPDPTNFKTSADRIRGLGVPVALNIFSNFRTMGRYRIDDVQATGLELTREPMGDLTRVVPGQININTAPLSVLRLLPLLSPNQGLDPLDNGGTAEWWGKGSSTNDLDGNWGVTTRNSDIAARMLAYRDKLWYQPTRPDLSASIRIMNYGNDLGGAKQYAIDGVGSGNGRFRTLNPTANFTRELVVREQPGFRSLGEVMMVTERDRTLVDSNQKPDPDSIDFTGWDTTDGNGLNATNARGAAGKKLTFTSKSENITVNAINSGRMYAKKGDTASPLERELVSGVRNSTDERLTAFNAIANSISVSSDYYACWFVLHGYKRTDVEGLKDGDPMVPSIARRYLMIIDRSNVQSQTDRPRIVVFKELPLTN